MMAHSKLSWNECCSDGPYHEGERQVQKEVGVEGIALRTGRVISDSIPNEALKFVDKQPVVVVSSQDEARDIWTSLLAGVPGFVTAEDEKNVHLDRGAIVSSKLDPFWENIQRQPEIGMLFIELATGRRLRVNGIATLSDKHLRVSVEQAYPNCPKYIQSREVDVVGGNNLLSELRKTGSKLTSELQRWIGESDTFFVGSSDAQANMDASHRGGNPGFVEVVDEMTLVVPDYPGNSMFNTLGNFWLNPKAGLLFVNFENGNTLQLSGEVEIVWQEQGAERTTAGTMRLWKFYVSKWILLDSLKNVNSKLLDYSPFNISHQKSKILKKGATSP